MSDKPQVWDDEAITNVIEADAWFAGEFGEGAFVLTCEDAIESALTIRNDLAARLRTVEAERDNYRASMANLAAEGLLLLNERDALRQELAESLHKNMMLQFWQVDQLADEGSKARYKELTGVEFDPYKSEEAQPHAAQ